MTAQTPVYGLKYLEPGQPVRDTRQVLEDNAKTVEAALVAGGVAAPGAADLLQLAGRVGALEAGPVVDLALTAPAAHVAGYRNAGVYRSGRQVVLTSLVHFAAQMVGNTTLATVTTVYRPAGTTSPIPLRVNGENGATVTTYRLDVYPDGRLSVVNTIPAGTYLFLDSANWPGA